MAGSRFKNGGFKGPLALGRKDLSREIMSFEIKISKNAERGLEVSAKEMSWSQRFPGRKG